MFFFSFGVNHDSFHLVYFYYIVSAELECILFECDMFRGITTQTNLVEQKVRSVSLTDHDSGDWPRNASISQSSSGCGGVSGIDDTRTESQVCR